MHKQNEKLNKKIATMKTTTKKNLKILELKNTTELKNSREFQIRYDHTEERISNLEDKTLPGGN